MRSKRLIGVALLLAIVGVACSKKTPTTSLSSPTPTASSTDVPATADADSGAATLRAGLTALLQEHVYLAGIAINTAVGTGLTSAPTKAAVAALDANSIALSDAINGVYPGAGATFLSLWRRHIGFFVDYTAAGGKGPKAAKAKADLDKYRQDFGAFLAAANPNLTKEVVATELIPHVKTLFAAIDAVLAKSPTVFAKLRAAAEHMPMTADILAGAIVKQFPSKFDGSESSGASALRAGLTALLQEHVYLAGIAINTAVGTGLKSAPTKAAVAALDANSVALSQAIDGVYPGAGATFLSLWRRHIGFFVDYTAAGGKGPKAAKARSDLDQYRQDFGAFLASANPNLTKEAVADELVGHVNTLFAAIDAVLAKSPTLFAKLREAAGHMPMTADILAGAIVKQFPAKFA